MKKLFFTILFTIIAVISSAQVDNVKLQQEFVKELNAYRASKGLSTVKLNLFTISSAKSQSEYCSSISCVTHARSEINPAIQPYGECALFTYSLTAKDILNCWIASPKHNEILLLDIISVGIYATPGMYNNITGYYIVLGVN